MSRNNIPLRGVHFLSFTRYMWWLASVSVRSSTRDSSYVGGEGDKLLLIGAGGESETRQLEMHETYEGGGRKLQATFGVGL